RARFTTSTNLSGMGCAVATAASERMEEAIDIIGRLWGGGPVTYNGKYFQVQVPQLRPRPVQRPQLPLWRGVISPSSFSECGRLSSAAVAAVAISVSTSPVVGTVFQTISNRPSSRGRMP